MSPHRNLCRPGAERPRGYSDATLAAQGRLLFLGGHVAFDDQRRIQHPGDLVSQLGRTLSNLRATLESAGGQTRDLVKLTIHVTDVEEYRSHMRELGLVWREVLGPVYPATTLLQVAGLFDRGALVEIDGIAVIPAEGD